MEKFKIVIVLFIFLFVSEFASATHGFSITEHVDYPQKPNLINMKNLATVVETYKNRQVSKHPWKAEVKTLEYPLYKKNGSTFSYEDESNSISSFSAEGESYSDPFTNCLSGPLRNIKISLTASSITIKLVEQIQVDCGFNERTGAPVKPKDPIKESIGCTSGSRNVNHHIRGNERYLECKTSSSCSHSIYQTPRRTGIKGRNSAGQSVTYAPPGSNVGDPYAPWRVKHSQTITMNFNTVAKLNKMSTQDLAWELICGGLKYIPSFKDKSNEAQAVEFYDEERIVLAYFLWKTFDLEKYLNSKAIKLENKGKELHQSKNYDDAYSLISSAYKIKCSEDLKNLLYDIEYEKMLGKATSDSVSLHIVYDYLKTSESEKHRTKAWDFILEYISKEIALTLHDLLSNLDIDSPESDFISSISLLKYSANEEFIEGITKLKQQKNQKARELAESFNTQTPIEIIDKAFEYANDQSTLEFVSSQRDKFKNNYKLVKGQYFKVGKIWYKAIPNTNEVEVSISRSNAYSGKIEIPETIIYKKKVYYVTGVGNRAFYNSNKLKSVKLPSSIKYIGYQAFYKCEKLTNVLMSDNLTELGFECFAHCFRLNNINLPSGLKIIPKGCFYNAGLKEVKLPASIEIIENEAFAKNRDNFIVNLNNNIKYIGTNAFDTADSKTVLIRFESFERSPNVRFTLFAPLFRTRLGNISTQHLIKSNTWCCYDILNYPLK